MPVLTVPKALRNQIGDEGSEALVDFFNVANNEQKENIIEIVEERFEAKLTKVIADLRIELKQDITNLRAELKEDNANLRAELKEDNANLRAELKEDNANLRAELIGKIESVQSNLIKWMFIFWTGQIVVLTAIMFAFLKR